MYPYPNTTAKANMSGLMSWSNSVTNGLFMPMMLLTIWVVAFLSLKDYGTHRAFASSSFLILVLTILLFTLGLVSNIVLIIAIAMVVVGVVWLWIAEKNEY